MALPWRVAGAETGDHLKGEPNEVAIRAGAGKRARRLKTGPTYGRKTR